MSRLQSETPKRPSKARRIYYKDKALSLEKVKAAMKKLKEKGLYS